MTYALIILSMLAIIGLIGFTLFVCFANPRGR
jgi:hypothetical protein